ncbi:uncharacterized protein LOC110248535 [Exaiptasia diaphana]|uniref:Uncharacterized protein n=1 Tax=Exaiptasia diaphana TaxID=2652724 RepID=A0A913XXE7_EXADI|nr:uncharacterized protein LOC110248535 [Exaiptasia diaphana]
MAENATESSYTESPTKGTEMTDEELRHLREDETPGMESPTRAKTRTRSQILGELLRVRKEMEEGRQSIASAPSVKPYTPDTYNDLSSYYNKYIVNYMIADQEDYVPRPGWGMRATSLKIVDTEVSWRMDNFPGPIYDSVVPRGFYKEGIWSKNLSGLDPSQGSTRLPPIPKVKYPKMNKDPKYKHFNMTYDHVQPFRADLKKIHDDKYKRKMEEDYKRTVNDWNRMNLIEIYQLPPQSTFNVKKAIQTYLGNSKGSIKALNPLLKQTPRSSVSSASTKA